MSDIPSINMALNLIAIAGMIYMIIQIRRAR